MRESGGGDHPGQVSVGRSSNRIRKAGGKQRKMRMEVVIDCDFRVLCVLLWLVFADWSTNQVL